MSDTLLFNLGFALVGLLLVVMTLSSSLISRVPFSSAILYLAVGVGIGPWGLGLLVLDPVDDAHLIERLTEMAVLISLFSVGLKLDLPLRDRRWRIPVQLASVSMVITVGAITAVGVWLLNLPLGAAVLLGAILAPTDPVLASDVQVADPQDRDRLRFGLTGEGGLNDGTAFPFVMLGLGLFSLHDLGEWGWRWWAVDVVWAVVGVWPLASCSAPWWGASSCTCVPATARPWARTSSWCWDSLHWPMGWPCCATPMVSWLFLPPGWHCAVWLRSPQRLAPPHKPLKQVRAAPPTVWKPIIRPGI